MNKQSNKYLPILLPLVISALGLAASWGATRTETNNIKTELQKIQEDNEKENERVRLLEIREAREEEILKNILQKLEEIQKKLDKSKQ